MPKEHKKRGKRESKKRKLEEFIDKAQVKRHKAQDADGDTSIIVEDHGSQRQEEYAQPAIIGEIPFYGMLDDEEQEYFKRADSILELNQFPDQGERDLFLANVYKEATGKELKIANSQSCSRLMERLILASTPAQVKELFHKFSGQYDHTAC